MEDQKDAKVICEYQKQQEEFMNGIAVLWENFLVCFIAG
jgi:hypothetical protein